MSARYSWLHLGVVALALIATVVASCKQEQAACENSSQCGDGFICGDRGVCENIPETDAGAPCPSTHRCLPAVPNGWMGPVVGTQAGDLLELAACPSSYSTEVSVVYSELVAEGECSCSCGTTGDFECSGAVLRAQTNCMSCLGCELVAAAANSCSRIRDRMFEYRSKLVQYSTGKVTSSASTCDPPSESNSLNAHFSQAERYCEAQASLNASCQAEGDLCLPDIDSSYSATCIYQTGDLSCPAAYPEKETRYAGYNDQRICSSCECQAPAVGTSCGGIASVGAWDDSTCSFTMNITGDCIDATEATGFVKYVPNSELPCTAAGAELSGEATTTGTTTFCCLAPIGAL